MGDRAEDPIPRSDNRRGSDHRRLPKHTLLPLDDCLYALQATIPHLTRSSLHRAKARDLRLRTLRRQGKRSLNLSDWLLSHRHRRSATAKEIYLFVAIDRT
jgi:hypothetical protein